MFNAAIIVFREVLEAALIIGIIAAATRGHPGRSGWLSAGVAAGVMASLVVAVLTGEISALADDSGQDIFNAAILAFAVLMLAWHNVWMQRHGRELVLDAKRLGHDVTSGKRAMSALTVVVALAVLREGSETALFLYSLLVGGQSSTYAVLAGGVTGLTAGALCGWALYAGFLHIPAKWFFSATSGLILLLAAAMSSQLARVLIQADLVPTLASPVWDTSWLLANDSPLGILLRAIAGYEAAPAGMQVVFYAGAFILISVGMRLSRLPSRPTLAS
jgi:high-affinity iron transporter